MIDHDAAVAHVREHATHYANDIPQSSAWVNELRYVADMADAAKQLEEALREARDLCWKARCEFAALVVNPADPNFSTAIPKLQDSACAHKGYIDIAYALKTIDHTLASLPKGEEG